MATKLTAPEKAVHDHLVAAHPGLSVGDTVCSGTQGERIGGGVVSVRARVAGGRSP